MLEVVVTGSYRPHEPDFGFKSNKWSEFKLAGINLGYHLAEGGHRLLLSWSRNNIFSQLGAKGSIIGNPQSHPYWETADFYALVGYLKFLEENKESKQRELITIRMAGKPNPSFINSSENELDSDERSLRQRFRRPFLHPDVLNTPLLLTQRADVDPGEALQEFPGDHWSNGENTVQQLRKEGVVRILEEPDPNSRALRSELVQGLIRQADATIVMGGGKSTKWASKHAKDKNLVIFASFSSTRAFSEVEEEAATSLTRLGDVIRSKFSAEPASDVAVWVAKNIRLVKGIEKDPDVAVITFRPDEYDGFQSCFSESVGWETDNESYTLGEIKRHDRRIRVATVNTIGQGPQAARRVTQSIIRDMPDVKLIVACGIAGTPKDADPHLGDIVISDSTLDFGGGKRGATNEASERNDVVIEIHNALERYIKGRHARLLYSGHFDGMSNLVLERLGDKVSADLRQAITDRDDRETIHFARIGGDGRLQRDDKSISEIAKAHRKLGAIDMESFAIHDVCRTEGEGYKFIAVRGISDVVGVERREVWTTYAAHIAGTCCYRLLESLSERILSS